MRARVDKHWIIGTAAAMFVLSATLFALSSASAGAATCDIGRFTNSNGTIDTKSYLQCLVPSVAPNSVHPGTLVHFTGGGFASNSSVSIELHSTPVTLGSTTADARGNVAADVVIPLGTSLGAHQIWAVGTDPTGSALTDVLAVTVTATSGSSLPFTGRNIGRYVGLGLALLALGGAVVWGAQRERSAVDA